MGTKQMHHNDRMVLQGCIAQRYTLKQTIKRVKYSRSTIFRELHRNIKIKEGFKTCSHCARLKECNKHLGTCDKFITLTCHELRKFPYVCNNCNRKHCCRFDKRYYDYEIANNLIHKRRAMNHLTITVSLDKFKIINDIVTNGVKNGQSLHHVYVNNKALHIVSERTIRRWIYSNRLNVKSHELPRYVAFPHKKEYRNKYHRVKNIAAIVGRTFKDYKEYIAKYPNKNIVQLDSVIGKSNDLKSLLTIYIPSIHFMFGRLINKSSPTLVNHELFRLRNILGLDLYKKIFQVVLTDNGFEFSHLSEIETTYDGEIITKVFYCDPYSSYQKGACEKNHELIRYIFSKGKTINLLNQEKVNLMFSHINSYSRSSINEKSPYELAKGLFGIKFLSSIGIIPIEPNKVNLKFNLIQ